MKDYHIEIYFKYDPEEKRTEEFGLETDDMESAKEFVKERKDFDIINYYIIEEIDGDEYYNSSEEPDFVDYN